MIGHGYWVDLPEISLPELLGNFVKQPVRMLGLPAILGLFLARFWNSKSNK
jgi:hypothetical protein